MLVLDGVVIECLHSIVGRDYGVVSIDQCALASCYGDGGLQAAALRSGGGDIDWSVHAAYCERGLVFILLGCQPVKRK